jgi:flagellar motor switch protein FliM
MAKESTAAQIRAYDFRRPDRLGKEQLTMLAGMFNAFGRFVAPEIGGLLRTSVRLSVSGIDQQSYEEILQKMPPFVCAAVLHVAELGGWVVAVLPAASGAILADLMLGGRGEMVGPERPMGETEQLVLERVFALWPDHLRSAWHPVAELEVSLDRLEGSLEFVQLASAQETVVVVHLVLEGVGDPVTIDVLLLHTGLQPHLARLRSATWAASSRQQVVTHRGRELVRRALVEAALPLSVTIEGLPLGFAELATLSVGDVIPLGHPCSRPLPLSIEGRQLAVGQLGAVGTRMAVQIVAGESPHFQEEPV